MVGISSVRLTVPKEARGEIFRTRLVERILVGHEKFIYVGAGAGYGKTTLLSQVARTNGESIWYSLAGENDLLAFLDTLCEAVRQIFPEFGFLPQEYIPFETRENFITMLANALIGSMEKLSDRLALFFDDLHTVGDGQIRELIVCFMRFAPENIRIFLGSREAPWPELMPLTLRGKILELKQCDLAFTKEETSLALGTEDAEIFRVSEGWPLAVGSFRVLLENGVSSEEITAKGRNSLYSYLFYECVSCLPTEMTDFLKFSACFEELDIPMLDAVLDRRNTSLMLESLASRNLFTVKTGNGHYRYHALFKNALLETVSAERRFSLQRKAAWYYRDEKDYTKAALYAMRIDDSRLLEAIVLESYRGMMREGEFGELRLWFEALGEGTAAKGPEILAARGAFLSYLGNFTEAGKYLDAAIPMLDGENRELYLETMVHKARILRNSVSFEESDALLDRLLSGLDGFASETAYSVVIEKLYNLIWTSRVGEAFGLVSKAMEECSREGNLKVRAWYERYLCAVSFFAGNMKTAVLYYERSLRIPENQREFLGVHDVGIYAAKAYQMLGERGRSLSLLNESLKKMRSCGKYEEMWSGYLFAAEIHYQNTSIDRRNGLSPAYDVTRKYFALADEYAPLYRRTEFQLQWADMLKLTYSLMFTSEPKTEIVDRIFSRIDGCTSYLSCIVFARLMGYYAAVRDLSGAVKCAKVCAETGEKSGMMLHPSLSYGVLARAAIRTGSTEAAEKYTALFLRCCAENGIYEYFRARRDYDPVLGYAVSRGIEPEATKRMMEFAGYKTKKAYVQTFGGFAVFSCENGPFGKRGTALKMRTKKERELLAYLLDVGPEGATKDQIFDAIWSESESNNIKRLIGVNLTQIKKDLTSLGMENPVQCIKKRYSICREEIVCDFELFEEACKAEGQKERPASLYEGEYLADFEALWAMSKRLHYRKLYEEKCLPLSGSAKRTAAPESGR